ncbi:MAG: hypothetical protein AABZ31_12340, partial [Bdellovibrionota bacterium]
QTKSLRSVTQLLETQAIQQDITRLYGNGTNCTTFFKFRDGNSSGVLPNLADSAGTVRYTSTPPGNLYAAGTLRLDNIFMVPVPPISLPNKRGQFMIRLEFSRTGSTSSQPRIVSNIPIFFKSDSGNMIDECTTNRQIIQAGLDCVRLTNPPANPPPQPPGDGFNRKVGCPTGYEVVGGGMQDADICKCGLINTVIQPGVDPLFPNGGWECQEQTSAGLTCYAICCRPAP